MNARVTQAWNRLVKAYLDDDDGEFEPSDGPSGGDDSLLAAYERDGLNRRVEKTVTAAGGGPRSVDYYYNANWQLLEEREYDESLEPVESRVYVWSPRYIDAPILRDRYDDEGELDESARLYYLGDANFNVTALLQENPQTPGTWQVAERYVYAPYGESTVYDASWSSNPQSPIPNPIRYAGYFLDSETGLYDVRHRPYHSTISTFLARDPLGYAAGDVNLYRYVGARPITHFYPSGLQTAPQALTPGATLANNITMVPWGIGTIDPERVQERTNPPTLHSFTLVRPTGSFVVQTLGVHIANAVVDLGASGSRANETGVYWRLYFSANAAFQEYGIVVAERIVNSGKAVVPKHAVPTASKFAIIANYDNFVAQRVQGISAYANHPDFGLGAFLWPHSNQIERGHWPDAVNQYGMVQHGRTVRNAAAGMTLEYIAGVYCTKPANAVGWIAHAVWTYTLAFSPATGKAQWTVNPRNAGAGDVRELGNAVTAFRQKY